jgi:hypothetical protein
VVESTRMLPTIAESILVIVYETFGCAVVSTIHTQD